MLRCAKINVLFMNYILSKAVTKGTLSPLAKAYLIRLRQASTDPYLLNTCIEDSIESEDYQNQTIPAVSIQDFEADKLILKKN